MSDEALKQWNDRRERLRTALAARAMSYQIGGRIIGGSGLPVPGKTLADCIRARVVLSVFHSSMVTFQVPNCVKPVENHLGKGLYLQVKVQNA